MMRHQRVVWVFLVGGLCVGCANPNPSSPSPPAKAPALPISETAIRNVVTNFAKGVTNAANATSISGRSLLVGPQALTSVLVNQPFSLRTNCAAGGYHETSGRISGTIQPEGVSKLIMNATTTIRDYRCMGAGWVINGDPYISTSGDVTITGQHAAFNFAQTLGWLATDDSGARFSCQHDIRIAWDDALGGTVRGAVVCSPPRTTVTVSASF